MTILTRCLLVLAAVLSLLNPWHSAEAADEYSIVYYEVAAHNGDANEVQWISNAIMYASDLYQVDPLLVTAVMEQESGFNLRVGYSSAGAIGLMQLMPDTAAGIGVNPYDPLQNVVGGTAYLRTQLDAFSGYGAYSVTDAVAAYNAGGKAVRDYGGVPPYRETINYVNSISGIYQRLLSEVG
jgi:soluble lytic murein transglycosylase-like protein